MNKLLAALLILMIPTPAFATGGMACRTAGPRPVEVSLGFGHVPGPLIITRLIDNGRPVPVDRAQWWFDNNEMRVLLIAPNAQREEVLVRARRNGYTYDGSLWRNGQRRWVRCRES